MKPKRHSVLGPISLIWAVVLLFAVAVAPSSLIAQIGRRPPPNTISTGTSGVSRTSAWPELEDLTYAVFGRRDGLTDGAIYSISRSQSGNLLLGTSDGGKHYTGRRWEGLPFPPNATELGVRFVLDAGPAGRYYVYDRWASLEKGRQWISHTQLPADQAPIYSAVLLAQGSSDTTLVVGASGGVFALGKDGQFHRMQLPENAIGRDAMVAKRETRDGTELWIGARGEGVFRLLNGKWTVWGKNNGPTNLAVEQVVPTPEGDSVTVAVATEGGVFLLVRDKWKAVGPKVPVSRVLRVRVRDTIETWLGTATGHIYRSRNGHQWNPLAPIPRTVGSRVQMIEAIDVASNTPMLFIGFRSGVLLRMTFGPAGRVVLPPALLEHSVTAVSTLFHKDSLWFWAMDYGAFRLPDFASVLSLKIPVVSGDPRAIVFVDTFPNQSRLLAAYDWRLFEQQGSSWKELVNAGERQAIHSVLRGPTPVGKPSTLVITQAGAWYEDNPSHFTKWTGFPSSSRAAAIDSLSGPSALTLVMSDGRVLRSDGGDWTEIKTETPAPSVIVRIGMAVRVAFTRLESGECVMLVGGTSGVGLLRTCGGKPEWQLLEPTSILGLLGPDVTDLRILSNHEAVIGSARGATLVRLGHTFADTLEVIDSFTDQDGLPHPYVTAIGPMDGEKRLWVGTPLGVGFIRLDEQSRRTNQPDIALVLVTDASGNQVHAGSRINNANARLQIDAFTTTYHRDEETMYRFELDGTPIATPGWTTHSTATLPVLPPGKHTLRIRAADYRGLEAKSRDISFFVLPPVWRSPIALLSYAAIFLIVIATFDRVRNRNALLRAQEAEANEKRISSSELRFRRLFEEGINPQLLVSDGMILQVNKAACALLEVNASDLMGRPLAMVLPTFHADAPSLAPGPHSDNELQVTGEYEIMSSQQVMIPVEVSHTRIPLDSSILDHFEMRDLRERNRLESERQRLENQLRDAQRLESVGTLAGGVAHDFNNLLTVIHSNAEVAASELAPASEAGQALQQLLKASERARLVVRQILTFSRKTEQHRESIRIQALLEETHSLLRSTIPSTIQLIISNHAHDAVVMGDATQLQQLLLNLCSNAEYAMRGTKSGTLTVEASWSESSSTKPDQSFVLLSVTDTGTGIPEGIQARMFEPFFTTKPVGEGTGLGLSVLHGIVNSHGGTISVTSALGLGSSFRVRLPAIHGADLADNKAESDQQSADHTKVRVLLVDDEEAVLTAIRRLLERAGFDVATAYNGAEALLALQTEIPFDVILTDQTMPVMTGTELAEHLRASGISTPIIIASGFGSVIDGARISHLADVQRIDKPFSSRDLTELLRRTAKLHLA